MTSAAQHQWEEIAAAVRARLANMAEFMPAMNPSEVQALVSTMIEAQWLEIWAAAFDQASEEFRQQCERGTMFGG